MACSRNVDFSVCSDDVADFASQFFAHFIACRCYSKWMFLIQCEFFLHSGLFVCKNYFDI